MNLTCQSRELMSLKHVRLVQESEFGQAPKQQTAFQRPANLSHLSQEGTGTSQQSVTAIIFAGKATKNGLVECLDDSIARYFTGRDDAFLDVLNGFGRHRFIFILQSLYQTIYVKLLVQGIIRSAKEFFYSLSAMNMYLFYIPQFISLYLNFTQGPTMYHSLCQS